MFLESHLAWATALCGLALWLLVAGPGSDRSISERLLIWCLVAPCSLPASPGW